jgi:O-acetyl-ADP-ribose deacetylase (regulator of RNase III)
MVDSTQWTHKSVVALKVDDPVGHMRELARHAALGAMADGWPGPPFDPVWLAEYLDIPVVQREDIRDARTVPGPDGKSIIEYNPVRPRGRLRFSIAHEIAHTFFPDCAEMVRNRAKRDEMEADEWQLEMLCNVGASEILMPTGSFPDLQQMEISIKALMEIRRTWDVSTEALLLRFIRLTERPCLLFAASKTETGAHAGRYRVEYAIGSSTWSHMAPIGIYLRDSSVVTECVAVGYTATGRDAWPGELPVDVECVGVSPYPGSTTPRVLGLAVVPDDKARPKNKLVEVVGDATQPRGETPQIIVQVMNNLSGTWGGGFPKKIAIKYPEAQIAYRDWVKEPGNKALGSVHFFGRRDGIEIATIIAQRGIGRSTEPRIDYPGLEQGLRKVADRAFENGASVHMPRIGCGAAGGKWEVVGELVDQQLVRRDVRVTVYDFAGAPRRV